MELNPNHSVTQSMSDQWHKIAALLMHKFGVVHVTISSAEIADLCEGQMKAVTIRFRDDAVVLDLVSMEEGERLAREEGGLPA